jgi:molybdopterin-guanine dinucleotide biosynthesis protein A
MVKLRPPVYGLVLTGGKSTRMKKDKAMLRFHNKPQTLHAFELLSKFCTKVFISARKQSSNKIIQTLPCIYDLEQLSDCGPLSGILTAMTKFPKIAWLVLACDLPFVDELTLKHLLRYRNASKIATAYRSHLDDLPEPLCAIYEPKARQCLQNSFNKKVICPRKILINSNSRLLKLKNVKALDNVNTPQDYKKAMKNFRNE